MNFIKKNFSNYLYGDEFIFNVGHQNKKIPLTSNNLEKICFALGPGKILINNSVVHPENNIGGNFVDFSYIVSFNKKSIY